MTDNFKIAYSYKVEQMEMKEAWGTSFGAGKKQMKELESVLNDYADRGYKLHTCDFDPVNSKGGLGGDRFVVTLVFEKENKILG